MMPTKEEIAAHVAKGGVWLGVFGDHRMITRLEPGACYGRWFHLHKWRPIDKNGNPMTLLAERDQLATRVAELEGKLDKSVLHYEHTTQWYAVRIERIKRIKDVAKAYNCWPQIAAVLANGTVSSDDPVNYARLLNRARHEADRASVQVEAAEAERDQYRSRATQLEEILHELADEVRAQRSTAAYQRSHGQQVASGRRRIDLDSYLARAGIEIAP